jgi:hypothetical protein
VKLGSKEALIAEMRGYDGPFQIRWIAEWHHVSPETVLDIAIDLEDEGQLKFCGASPCTCGSTLDWCQCGREVYQAVVGPDLFMDGGGI